MSDIPPHDMSSDFVIMAEQRHIEAELAKKLEVGALIDTAVLEWRPFAAEPRIGLTHPSWLRVTGMQVLCDVTHKNSLD